MADSLRVQGQTSTQRLNGAPSEPPPNRHSALGESASTERVGEPLRCAPSCVEASSPKAQC
eukprot:11695938-Alexandrium_andersonii.AAC.1